MNHPSKERHPAKTCHVCGGARFYYLFSASDYRVVRCDDCGLVFLNPQPSDDEFRKDRQRSCRSFEKPNHFQLRQVLRIHQTDRLRLRVHHDQIAATRWRLLKMLI